MAFIFLKSWFSPWRAYLAEFLGTFVFVFVSCGVVLADIFYGEIGPVGIALASGLSISAMMLSTNHISGGYLNPAITLAMWLAQKVTGTRAFFYILFQFLAGLAAVGVLLLIFGQKSLKFSLGGSSLGAGVSLQTGFVLEALLAAVLVFVFFATMVDKKGNKVVGPLVVGMVVMAAVLFTGRLIDATFNPARSFGTAIVSGNYEGLAVFLVGPALGAIFGVVYDFVFLRKVKR